MKHIKELSYLILLAFAALVFSNCGTDDYVWTDDGTTNDSTKIDSLNVNRLVIKKVYFQLPTELESVAKDWTVNTIFSTDDKPTDSLTAEFYDENSQELIVALNESGNVTLMAFQSAFGKDSIEMSLETTAEAMVMLMPWTQNMAPTLKKQVMDDLQNHPEFDNLVDALNASLQGGEIDPLVIAPVLNKLTVLQEKVSNKKLEITEEPVKLIAENSTLKIENRLSSAYLGIGVYDKENKLVKVDKVDGYEKTSLTLEYLKSRIFEEPLKFPTAELNIEYEGEYSVVIDNGFTGEDSEENSLAFKWNMGKATLNVLSVVSPIFKASNDNIKCVIEFSEKTAGFGSDFSSSIVNAPSGETNFFLNSLEFVSKHTISLAEYLSDCLFTKGYRPLGINSKVLKKILNTVSVIGKVQTVIDATFFAADIFAYDTKREFCLEMDENGGFEECSNFNFEGTWSWQFINYNSKEGLEDAYYIVNFSLDKKGVYKDYYSYRYPRTSGKSYTSELPGRILLKYEDGKIILPGTTGGPHEVLVIDENADVFYSENWDSTYTAGTTYKKDKLIRF